MRHKYIKTKSKQKEICIQCGYEKKKIYSDYFGKIYMFTDRKGHNSIVEEKECKNDHPIFVQAKLF